MEISEASQLHQQCIRLYGEGDFEGAIQVGEAALDAYTHEKNRDGEAQILGVLGVICSTVQNHKAAISFWLKALSIAKALQDRKTEGLISQSLGISYLHMADYTRALEFEQQSLAIAREIRSLELEGNALVSLGPVYYAIENLEKSIASSQSGIEIARELNDLVLEGQALSNLGIALLEKGDFSEAKEHLEHSLEISTQENDRRQQRIALTNLSSASNGLKDYELAISYAERSLRIANLIQDKEGIETSLYNLGIANNALGNFDTGIKCLKESLRIAQEIKDLRGETRAANALVGFSESAEDATVSKDMAVELGVRFQQERNFANKYDYETYEESGLSTNNNSSFAYIVATVRPPLDGDAIQEIQRFWVSHHFSPDAPTDLSELVILNELEWNKGSVDRVAMVGEIQFFEHFPVVGLLMNREHIQTFEALPFIKYVHDCLVGFSSQYLKLLRAFDSVLKTSKKQRASVINLSLQSPYLYAFNQEEPMNVATRILSENGISVVVAAGNYGGIGNNSLNPWSVAPWVIGVGAASADGRTLWPASSRGIPGDPICHPTVVAPGIDISLEFTPDDINSATFLKKTWWKLRGKKWTVKQSGTSVATPHVTAVVTQCQQFIRNFFSEAYVREWQVYIETNLTDLERKKIEETASYSTVVRRMIEDMAVAMPNYARHEVGAGFVNKDIASEYFKNFKPTDLKRILLTESWSPK